LPFKCNLQRYTMDLFCIYKELKSVQLRTINKERGGAVQVELCCWPIA
jgi:hypothetical protein